VLTLDSLSSPSSVSSVSPKLTEFLADIQHFRGFLGFNTRSLGRLREFEEEDRSLRGTVGQWPVFLGGLADLLGGTLPTLFRHDPRNHSGSFDQSVGYEPQALIDYRERFAGNNVWLCGARPHLIPGRVRFSHMMCSRYEFFHSPWWTDFCRPLGVWQAIGATILKHDSVTYNKNSSASYFFEDRNHEPGRFDPAGQSRSSIRGLVSPTWVMLAASNSAKLAKHDRLRQRHKTQDFPRT